MAGLEEEQRITQSQERNPSVGLLREMDPRDIARATGGKLQSKGFLFAKDPMGDCFGR